MGGINQNRYPNIPGETSANCMNECDEATLVICWDGEMSVEQTMEKARKYRSVSDS